MRVGAMMFTEQLTAVKDAGPGCPSSRQFPSSEPVYNETGTGHGKLNPPLLVAIGWDDPADVYDFGG